MNFIIVLLVILFFLIAFLKPIYGLALICITAPFVQLMDISKMPIGLDKILGLVVLFGFLFNMLNEKGRLLKFKRTPLDGPIILLSVAYTFAFSMSFITRAQGLNNQEISRYLSLLSLFAIYFLTTNLVKDKRSFKMLFVSIFLGGILLASVSLFLYLTGIKIFLGIRLAQGNLGAGVLRLQGFSGNPNSFATLFVMLFPLPILMIGWSRTMVRKLTFLVISVLFFAAIIPSYSRSAYLGCLFGVGLACLILLYLKKINFPTFLKLSLIVVIVVVILMSALSHIGVSKVFWGRVKTISTGEISGGREILYPASVKMVLSNPLGVGFGNFQREIVKYGAVTSPGSHNTILGIGGEAGLLGLFAIIWFIYRQIKIFLVKIKEASHSREIFVLAGFLAGTVAFWIHSSFHSFLHWGVVWIFFGLGMAFCRITQTSKEK